MEFSSELSSLIAHEILSKEVYKEREYSDYKQFFFSTFHYFAEIRPLNFNHFFKCFMSVD